MAAAINNKWPNAWQENSWQTGQKKQVKDMELWRDILEELEETGHVLSAERGKHEYSAWMVSNMPRISATKDTFKEVDEVTLNLVSH